MHKKVVREFPSVHEGSGRFFDVATQGNYYLAQIKNQHLIPRQANDMLFRAKLEEERHLQLQNGPKSSHTLEDIKSAIVIVNFGLVMIVAMKALNKITTFYDDHVNRRKNKTFFLIDGEEAILIGLLELSRSMKTYNPDGGSGLYTYAEQNIEEGVYKHLLSPSFIGESTARDSRAFIFRYYPHAKAVVSQMVADREISASAFEESLIRVLHKTAIEVRLNPPSFDDLREVYRGLINIDISLDHLRIRRRMQDMDRQWVEEYGIGVQGSSGLPSATSVIKTEGNEFSPDPQSRSEMLVNNLDPGNPQWQTLLLSLFTETFPDFEKIFTKTQWEVFLEMFMPIDDKNSPHYGAFPTYQEIGERRGVAKQNIHQIRNRILEQLGKFYGIKIEDEET